MAIRKRTWTSGGKERSAWVVDYRAHDPSKGKEVRCLKTFPTKRAAESWATDTLFDVKQGVHTPDSASITIAEAADLWLKRGELESLERSTLEQYRVHADRHVKPMLGGTKLSRLTRPMVEAFKDKLLETRSRAMAQKVMTSLKSILNEAQRRGLVAQNAAIGVAVRRPTRHKEHVEIPTKEEINKILEAASGRWRPLLITAIFTGLRASELRGLAWGHVDFQKRVLRVRQRADEWNQIGSPKSRAGKRDVPLPPMALNVLKEWKLACPQGSLRLVFPNGKGNVESLANIYNRGLAPLQIGCGIVGRDGKPKYGMHALRHFYASWLIDQGFQPKRVQTLLGHSSIVMTMDVYSHLFPSDDDDHTKLAAGEISLVG